MQATNNLPRTALQEQQPSQNLTTLRAELNRLKRARAAFPRNAKHYNNLIAQVQERMATVYTNLLRIEQ